MKREQREDSNTTSNLSVNSFRSVTNTQVNFIHKFTSESEEENSFFVKV